MPIALPSPATQVLSFHVDAPLTRVMPLFTAEGERSWAPGWEPKILSGAGERGSAFATHSQTGAQVTWIVTDFRPKEGHASYARLVEDSNIGLVDVICTVAGRGTDVSVRYTLTPLSPTGATFVADFLSESHYTQMMEEWRSAISRWLAAQNTKE